MKQYFNAVRGTNSSWFAKYIDPKPYVTNSGEKYYVLKKLNRTEELAALDLLKDRISKGNKALAENATLGENGESPIKNPNI